MGIPKDLLREHPELSDWAILSGYRGSIAHGTYLKPTDPNSVDDKDTMTICVPPIEYYFGLKDFGSRGTKEIKRDEWDIVVYEAKKFIHLLAQGNPNVLMMLWLEPQHYLKIEPSGQAIIDSKHLFVGRHVYRAFTGYAHGQLYRMTHNAAMGHLGAKRKALIEKYGYDCKNASHLIRLLRMGAEFMKDGVLYVTRHDANQLLEIKRGEWTLEQVQKEAEHGFKVAEQAYHDSTLPIGPDFTDIERLLVSVIHDAHSRML